MLISTLPPVHQEPLLRSIIEHPAVAAVRYNTGTGSRYDAYETLKRINDIAKPLGKPFYVDLKGKQLRSTDWSIVPEKPIILNHNVSVDLPARVQLRGDASCELLEVVDGNKLYVDGKESLVGPGQSINILGKNLKIEGGLLPLDHEYIKAALGLGIVRFLLSFVESREDVLELEEAIAKHSRGTIPLEACRIVFKIESQAGLTFVAGLAKKHFAGNSPYRLMAARDDLMVHIGVRFMPAALRGIIDRDPNAICASRLLMGLESGAVSMADVSDIEYMRSLGYKHFMLSDGISREFSQEACGFWQEYVGSTPMAIGL